MADYQQLYEQHHSRPLRERSNRREHPEPVATTWDLSFRAVAPQDPAAADLLRFCAFLAPDALLTTGARVLGPRLAPVAADPLALRTYLLVERDGEARTLSVHRLVQAVVREALAEEEQRTWAGRAVLAMEKAFPWPDVRTNWDRCQQLLPHARVCATWIEQWSLGTFEAARVLFNASRYLADRAVYAEAEQYGTQALVLSRALLGEQHPTIASSLNNLANVYYQQGKDPEAEAAQQQALAISRATLGEQHPDTARSLYNLGLLYQRQGKHAQALSLVERALDIRQQMLGQEHPATRDVQRAYEQTLQALSANESK